jgi:hypothetical protein
VEYRDSTLIPEIMKLTALQDVAKDALFVVSCCTVPTFVAELVLAFLNAPACAIRHRTNGVWVLQANFDLLFREAWQRAAHRSSCCHLRVFLRLSGAWWWLWLVELQLWRHTNQTQVPETHNFTSQQVLYADENLLHKNYPNGIQRPSSYRAVNTPARL